MRTLKSDEVGIRSLASSRLFDELPVCNRLLCRLFDVELCWPPVMFGTLSELFGDAVELDELDAELSDAPLVRPFNRCDWLLDEGSFANEDSKFVDPSGLEKECSVLIIFRGL